MKQSVVMYLLLIMIVSISAHSQSDIVSATFKYNMGDNDTRNDAKKIALLEAKRLCVEKVGTYVEGKISRKVSESIKNDNSEYSDITKQDIITFIGAIVKIDIVDEKFSYSGETQTLTTTVRATVNTKDIGEKLKQIKDDDDLKNKVLKQQNELKDLQSQFLELQKRINKTSPEKAYTLREQRTEIFQEIDGLEAIRFEIKRITNIAVSNIDIGMIKDDVKKVAGNPRSTDHCLEREYWNYGDVWVMFISGVVSSVFDVRYYKGSCWGEDYYRSVSKK